MKKFIIIALAFNSFNLRAETISPLVDLRTNIENVLANSGQRKSLDEVKKLADDKNLDIDYAIENYIVAKRNVSVARAQFSPITTGQILGISLGLTYLWVPLAVDAVLSIPTKYHNVKRTQHVASAEAFNLIDVRNEIKNEVAHLYFDILTHESILRTIDLETSILNYQLGKWEERQLPKARLNDQKKWLLRLGIERNDIFNLYREELSGLKTLVSTSKLTDFELLHITNAVERKWIENLDITSIENKTLSSSPKYKSSKSLEAASLSNVKAVKWSIISLSGLKFSYKREVVAAKNAAKVADLKKQSVALQVKNNISLKLNNLESSLDVYNNYADVSDESLNIFSDSYESMLLGNLNEDHVVETALTAIRDFRSKIVAHYSAWSNLDDFSLSTNYDFNTKKYQDVKVDAPTEAPTKKEEPKKEEPKEETNVQNPTAEDFKVVVTKNGRQIKLKLNAAKGFTGIKEIDYIFNSKKLDNISSSNAKNGFEVSDSKVFMPKEIHGVALVNFTNGDVLRVKF